MQQQAGCSESFDAREPLYTAPSCPTATAGPTWCSAARRGCQPATPAGPGLLSGGQSTASRSQLAVRYVPHPLAALVADGSACRAPSQKAQVCLRVGVPTGAQVGIARREPRSTPAQKHADSHLASKPTRRQPSRHGLSGYRRGRRHNCAYRSCLFTNPQKQPTRRQSSSHGLSGAAGAAAAGGRASIVATCTGRQPKLVRAAVCEQQEVAPQRPRPQQPLWAVWAVNVPQLPL